MEVEPTSFPFSRLSPSLCVFKLVYLCELTCAQLILYQSNVDAYKYKASIAIRIMCWNTISRKSVGMHSKI